MSRFAFLTALLCVIACGANADPLLPTEPGTTWTYAVVDVGNEPRTQIVRIAGTEQFEGKPLLKFETLRDNSVIKTELCEVSERGVVCYARGARSEMLTKLDPPQMLVPAELKTGATWESDGVVADVQLHQVFTVAGEEDVYVPVGKFRAFRLHMEGTTVVTVELDRWFTPGIGIVKEETTLRGPGGGLLQRTRMELQKRPEVIRLPTPSPSPSPSPTPSSTSTPAAQSAETPQEQSGSPQVSVPRKRLIVEVTDDPAGGFKTHFKSNTQAIYVRWHGHGLPEGARIRVAWVAEDVGGIVEPNFIVDQTENVAPASDSSARFTLGRPEDGWADGKYRVEFYVDGELEETVPVIIGE